VFKVKADHPLALALGKHSYHDIQDILGVSHEDIEVLTYEDDQDNEIDLPRLYRSMIHILKAYHCYCCSEWGTPIGDDWKSIIAWNMMISSQ
jgi:hypothetical protein